MSTTQGFFSTDNSMRVYYILCYINKHGLLSECVNNEMMLRDFALLVMRRHNRNSSTLRYALKKVYV
jgi:hypothetical protein